MDFLVFFVSLFVSFFEVYMAFMILNSFYKHKYNNRYIYIFSGALYIVLLWVLGDIEINGNIYLKLIVAVALVVIIALTLYSGGAFAKIIHVFTYFTVDISCDLLVYYVGNYFTQKTPYGVALDEIENIPLAIISKLLQFTIYSIIIRFGKQKEHKLLTKDFLALIFISVISLITAIALFFQSSMSLYVRGVINIIVSLGVLMLNFFMYYLFTRSKRLAVTEKEKELLEQKSAFEIEKFSELEKLQRNIDILRHDMKNHLSVAQRLMSVDGEKAREYIQEVTEEITRNSPDFGGNTVVDAVLHGKLLKARELGIELDISLNMDKDVAVDKMDLCSIFSNALDNAIEAQASPGPGRYVMLSTRQKDSFLSIKVVNPCCGMLKTDTNRKILSTKAGGNHGIGLKSIARVVEKYDGQLDYRLEDGLFSLSIIMNV